VALLLASAAGVGHAATPEEAIIPLERYTSQKARALATAYQNRLKQIYTSIYHCYEWMEIPKRGLGFVSPKDAKGDERYLKVWVWIDQQVTPAFAAAASHQRASAMLQRYGLGLLRRLSSYPDLLGEPALTGFAVVLTWMKPGGAPRPGVLGINETLAIFVDKTTLQRFLKRQASPAEFIERSIVNGFDGATALGRLPLEIFPLGTGTDGQPAC